MGETGLHSCVTHSLIVCPRPTTHGTTALLQDSMQLVGELCGGDAVSMCPRKLEETKISKGSNVSVAEGERGVGTTSQVFQTEAARSLGMSAVASAPRQMEGRGARHRHSVHA